MLGIVNESQQRDKSTTLIIVHYTKIFTTKLRQINLRDIATLYSHIALVTYTTCLPIVILRQSGLYAARDQAIFNYVACYIH